MEEADLQIARRLGQAELLRDLIQGAWPKVDPDDLARLMTCSPDQLRRWGRRLVAGWSPEEIFREHRTREHLIAVLGRRFPDLPPHRQAMLRSADWDRLSDWAERLEDAEHPDQVFAVTLGDRLFEEGYEIGYQQGMLIGFIEVQARRQFGDLPDWVVPRLKEAKTPDLERWAVALAELDRAGWLRLVGEPSRGSF